MVGCYSGLEKPDNGLNRKTKLQMHTCPKCRTHLYGDYQIKHHRCPSSHGDDTLISQTTLYIQTFDPSPFMLPDPSQPSTDTGSFSGGGGDSGGGGASGD